MLRTDWRKARVEAEKLFRSSYSSLEGYIGGLNQASTSRGGKKWMDFRFYFEQVTDWM